MEVQETIAAIATALSTSGIGIIRISGPEAFSIADKIFRPASDKGKLSEAPGYTMHYGYIFDGEQMIDEVLASVFRAPHSYTAEDTVEINCHGGVYAMQRVLSLVLGSGARAALPGEFTKRAFLNGRIGLSQAEAVMDLIEAKNEYAMQNCVRQLKGSLQRKLVEIRSDLLYQTAQIEAALDDPEHYDLMNFTPNLQILLEKKMVQIQKLMESFDNGRMLQEGIQTAIVGKPNVGKSSLLNALLGDERAIVTEIAGTTRDVLTETVRLSGLTLLMMDTAGIHKAQDQVEQIGVDRAKHSMQHADLVLYVTDGSKDLNQDDEQILGEITEQQVILVINKSDLPVKTEEKALSDLWQKLHPLREVPPICRLSAKESSGIEALMQTITDHFVSGNLRWNDELIITNLRQKEKLMEAQSALERVMESIDDQLPEDFYTIDLTQAISALGEITGDSIGDDLINEIFEKFCMGK